MGKFDKIIKENLSKMILPLAQLIGMDIAKGKIDMIKDKLQHTIDRRIDIVLVNGLDFP